MIIDNGQARAALLVEAMTWLDTPYHHHARIKGVGVDCAQLLLAVYGACGFTLPADPGQYAVDWHLHRSEEQFAGWIEGAGGKLVQTPAPGDIALFKFGRCFSHGAIVIDESAVIHALTDRAVVINAFTDAELRSAPVRFYSLWS